MENPQFITDHSLAKLAKWLRLLGYDTMVFPKEAGREMLRLADRENRIVLTRRNDMTQRQFTGRLLLISDLKLADQINAVIQKFSLKIQKEKMFGICLLCNAALQSVRREDVQDTVPQFVFENCVDYNRCPRCGKIYWMGTHPRNALKFIEQHIPSGLP